MKAPGVRVSVVAMGIFAALVMLLCIVHVNRRQEIIRLGYELSEATRELSRLSQENRALRLEKSALSNPERVRRLAESLGMRQPGPAQIRVIGKADSGLAQMQAQMQEPMQEQMQEQQR